MSTALPFTVVLAKRSFHKQRANYYAYLASLIASTGKKIQIIFETDAQRHGNSPRGILSAYWAATFIQNGSNLALTWEGTLPDDEVALIRVLEDVSEEALITAIHELSRIAKLKDKIRKDVVSTLAVGVFALILGFAALAVMPGLAVAEMLATLKVPVSYWGASGQRLAKLAQFNSQYALPIGGLLAMSLFAIAWSVPNFAGSIQGNSLAGKVRTWLDSHIAIYRLTRDVCAVSLLGTLAVLTGSVGGNAPSLRQSIEKLLDAASSRWTYWRLSEIHDRIVKSGATSVDVFDTPMLPQEIFWHLRDMEESKDFGAAFIATSQYVEDLIVPSLVGKLIFYRYAALAIGLVTVFVVSFLSVETSREMKSVMTLYMQSQ